MGEICQCVHLPWDLYLSFFFTFPVVPFTIPLCIASALVPHFPFLSPFRPRWVGLGLLHGHDRREISSVYLQVYPSPHWATFVWLDGRLGKGIILHP